MEHSKMHAHVHEHADGTVHSHYHIHPNGEVAHDHAPAAVPEELAHCCGPAALPEELANHSTAPAGQRAEVQQPATSLSGASGHHHHGDVIALDSSADSADHVPGKIPVHSHERTAVVAPPLEAHGLTYTYPHKQTPVFKNLSLHAHPGQVLAILGNNGAGKSTLLDLLAGITASASGHVHINGKDARELSRNELARRVAYVAQQQTVPHLSVYDEVLLGRKPHISWSITEKDREIVSQAIIDLELEDFTARFCDELSGGERQKVFIARALAQEPHILLLDEPTSALDPKNQLEVLELVRRITHEGGLATVMVLHDVNLALRFCDHFLLVRSGEVVAHGDLSAVTGEALSATYDTPFKMSEIDGIPVALPA